ncbi:hypothetical protein [Polynucleobacter necessarius]|uniref:hypothetical protein n=1 Tax=Polynucleobacter necessarius TaxID=576610 RepID=UPI000E096354|nr:hypothetical protein [Polynucleobacter necessarius]
MLTKMKNIQRFLIGIVAIIGLASCTTYRYEYTAPPTESGKTCAVQCMNTKNVCYSGAQTQAQNDVLPATK